MTAGCCKGRRFMTTPSTLPAVSIMPPPPRGSTVQSNQDVERSIVCLLLLLSYDVYVSVNEMKSSTNHSVVFTDVYMYVSALTTIQSKNN